MDDSSTADRIKATPPSFAKFVTLDFTEDGYADFHAEAGLLPTISALAYLANLIRTDWRLTVLAVFRSWDFVDFDGKPIPHDLDGVIALPRELRQNMWRRHKEAVRDEEVSRRSGE